MKGVIKMSAYIVNDKTIHAIVKGFEMYKAEYRAKGYKEPIQIIIDLQEIRNGIGQSLLNQNYKSVNFRYNKNDETPIYNYEDVEINEGILLGCIDCYIYQACETDDFFESELYKSLVNLKNAMLEKMINAKGYEIPWGYKD